MLSGDRNVLTWFLGAQPPTQAAIVSGMVSIIVALFVAFLNPFGQRRLERLKANLTAENNNNLERLKASLTEESNHRIEQLRLSNQGILEQFKSDLKRSESLDEAWKSYAFDARKNLYNRFEPLLFQLSEATENSYYRVISLARSAKQGRFEGEHAWLADDSYYLRQTIYFLFAPTGIFRLMRQAVNFVDLKLDPEIRMKYYLCKLYNWSFTDDFKFAELAEYKYDPESIDQSAINYVKDSPHYKQGLYVGHLEAIADRLVIKESERQRLMTYGEFETSAWNESWLEPAKHIFLNFDFSRRPVLGLMLLSQAMISRLILCSFVKSFTASELKAALRVFCSSETASNHLRWWKDEAASPFNLSASYIEDRLGWMSPDYYDIDLTRQSPL